MKNFKESSNWTILYITYFLSPYYTYQTILLAQAATYLSIPKCINNQQFP